MRTITEIAHAIPGQTSVYFALKLRDAGIATPADVTAPGLHKAEGIGKTAIVELAVLLSVEVCRLQGKLDMIKEGLS